MLVTILFFLNIFAPLVLLILLGYFNLIYFIISFVCLFIIFALFDRLYFKLKYVKKSLIGLRLFIYFIWEIFLANLRVAYDVITPKLRAKPGVIAVPLDCRSDVEITILAIIISLTPGTLVLDISSDKKTLFIHAMYIRNVEKLKSGLKKNFERPIMEILE